jgi:hypothetical protein
MTRAIAHHGLLMAGGSLWTPANLTSPASLWYDDQSPLTNVSGVCSQRNDRSANSWNQTQTTASNRPLIVAGGLNGLQTIRYDGSNDSLNIPSAALGIYNAASVGWLFGVYKKIGSDAAATSRRVFVFTNNSTGARLGIYWDDGTASAQNRVVVGARRTDAGAYNRVQSTTTSFDQWVAVLARVSWAARTIDLYVNGALDAGITSAFDASGTTSATNSASASTGASTTGASAWHGEEACSLCGNAITTDDIDRLFGAYMWRYGLEGNLPIGHPYKTEPPYV